MTLHFLHIGKTGGTAIKYALRTAGWACWASEYKKKSAEMPETRYGHLILHRHFFGLQELEPEDYLFFSLRDPYHASLVASTAASERACRAGFASGMKSSAPPSSGSPPLRNWRSPSRAPIGRNEGRPSVR